MNNTRLFKAFAWPSARLSALLPQLPSCRRINICQGLTFLAIIVFLNSLHGAAAEAVGRERTRLFRGFLRRAFRVYPLAGLVEGLIVGVRRIGLQVFKMFFYFPLQSAHVFRKRCTRIIHLPHIRTSVLQFVVCILKLTLSVELLWLGVPVKTFSRLLSCFWVSWLFLISRFIIFFFQSTFSSSARILHLSGKLRKKTLHISPQPGRFAPRRSTLRSTNRRKARRIASF